MRHVLTAVAAIAACGLVAATSARAEVQFQPGGPKQIGKMCQVFTDSEQMYGYLAPCPKAQKAKVAVKRKTVQGEIYFQPGGPKQIGGMCQIFTDSEQMYGYVAPCPKPQAKAAKPRKKKVS